MEPHFVFKGRASTPPRSSGYVMKRSNVGDRSSEYEAQLIKRFQKQFQDLGEAPRVVQDAMTNLRTVHFQRFKGDTEDLLQSKGSALCMHIYAHGSTKNRKLLLDVLWHATRSKLVHATSPDKECSQLEAVFIAPLCDRTETHCMETARDEALHFVDALAQYFPMSVVVTELGSADTDDVISCPLLVRAIQRINAQNTKNDNEEGCAEEAIWCAYGNMYWAKHKTVCQRLQQKLDVLKISDRREIEVAEETAREELLRERGSVRMRMLPDGIVRRQLEAQMPDAVSAMETNAVVSGNSVFIMSLIDIRPSASSQNGSTASGTTGLVQIEPRRPQRAQHTPIAPYQVSQQRTNGSEDATAFMDSVLRAVFGEED